MTHWTIPFVGLPYQIRGRTLDGVDCWGLCYIAWRANGIEAPSYAGDYLDDRESKETAALIGDKSVSGPWQPIEHGQEQEFDLLTFNVAGFESHVGMVIAPYQMLHIKAGGTSHVARYDDARWSRRLASIYRYVP